MKGVRKKEWNGSVIQAKKKVRRCLSQYEGKEVRKEVKEVKKEMMEDRGRNAEKARGRKG